MTISRSASVLGLAIGIGSVAVSCAAGNPDERMTPAAGRAPRVTQEKAADAVARMRCDREQRCEHIGLGEKFDSFTRCIERMHLEVAEGMGRACTDGVAPSRLRYCLGEIAASDCSAVGPESYPACHAATLCG